LALLTVGGALGFGLISFYTGGNFNAQYANGAMRWRVLLQAGTLVIFFLILWFKE
jgi:hypothetical protein